MLSLHCYTWAFLYLQWVAATLSLWCIGFSLWHFLLLWSTGFITPWHVRSSRTRDWTCVPCFAGEGNGTPLQYSCLENPMDGGAWWAEVHGVAKLDMTERLHFYFSLTCIGGGGGNPLQCSCLENPRDRGAWWAAVYGVAQSRTRLKRLSSSSSPCFARWILNHWSAREAWTCSCPSCLTRCSPQLLFAASSFPLVSLSWTVFLHWWANLHPCPTSSPGEGTAPGCLSGHLQPHSFLHEIW